mmetsp:Transcript_4192/g.9093  ORF Transcript_4192/g.9093 Transcript_4192/m.9093 type:complete len:232 (-) Transcript_4192:542-1237(-)
MPIIRSDSLIVQFRYLLLAFISNLHICGVRLKVLIDYSCLFLLSLIITLTAGTQALKGTLHHAVEPLVLKRKPSGVAKQYKRSFYLAKLVNLLYRAKKAHTSPRVHNNTTEKPKEDHSEAVVKVHRGCLHACLVKKPALIDKWGGDFTNLAYRGEESSNVIIQKDTPRGKNAKVMQEVFHPAWPASAIPNTEQKVACNIAHKDLCCFSRFRCSVEKVTPGQDAWVFDKGSD